MIAATRSLPHLDTRFPAGGRPFLERARRALGPAGSGQGSSRRSASIWSDYIDLHEAAFPLRTRIFDEEVATFLLLHPRGTVIEIGGGVQSQCERLGHGQATWVDLEGAMDGLAPGFEEGRAQADLVKDWEACSRYPGPYCFVVGTHLMGLDLAHHAGLAREIGKRFPGAWMVMDAGASRLASAKTEACLLRLLLSQRPSLEVEAGIHELRCMGAIVDRSRSLLAQAPQALMGLPSWYRWLYWLMPGPIARRFGDYRVLRVVLSR